MSAALAPHTEVVSTRKQRRARPKPFYALVVISVLFVLFMAQLVMSIAVSDGAYEISGLKTEQRELVRTASALTEKLNVVSSTQSLAESAEARGMVSGNPVFLDPDTGKTSGKVHTSKSPNGSIGNEGNLIANALLAEDGNAIETTDESDEESSRDDEGTTTASTGKTTKIDGGSSDSSDSSDSDDSASDDSGAPAGDDADGSVTSDGTLPSPITR